METGVCTFHFNFGRFVTSIHFGDEKLSRQRLPPVSEVQISAR